MKRNLKVGQRVALVKNKGRKHRSQVIGQATVTAVIPTMHMERYRYRLDGSMIEREEGQDPGVLREHE